MPQPVTRANHVGAVLAAGSGTWSSFSDKTTKENYEKIDKQEILDRLVAMPVEKWNYKTQDDNIKHIGPYAQDFKKAFGLGSSSRTIATIDADGIAMAAIQALAERNKKLEAKTKALEERILKLEQLLQ